jgi:hypothetical protein
MVTDTVMRAIPGVIDKNTAAAFIKQQAEKTIPLKNHSGFLETVETEIMSLHKGNIAHYRLRPLQYLAWRKKRH